MPLLNSPALQNVLEMKEVVEKQQQIKDVEVIYYKNVFTDKLVVPNEQKASSILPTEVPQGKPGMTSTLNSAWQTVAQVKQDIESQWYPKELGCDAVQNRQHVRCSDSSHLKVGELEEGLTVIHDEVAQSETETPIKERTVENADTQTNVPTLEEKSVDEFTEEVKGVNHKLNEDLNVLKKENTDMNELSQGEVHTLNEQLSCLNERCTVLEQKKEQLSLEVQRVQKAASDLQFEKENLVTDIQSSEAQLKVSTYKQKCLQEELEALQEWKQKVLEDVATLETQKEGSQVELHSLRGSVRELQNHIETLEGERRALKDAAENAKHSQRQLQQELEQAHSEKSVLQNQVEHLQNTAAELNKEKIYLQGKLKQWESPSADKEVPTDCLQQRGLHDDLLPTNNHQQDLLNQHQELEMTNNTWSTTTQLPNDLAEPENQEMDADCEPESLTNDGVAVTGQQMVDHLVEKVEQDQTETSQRSNYSSQLPDASARLNPAELAMKINPAELAARIRRSRQFRHHLSVAFDETEYEPYGLPDVVQKGFADIPSGSFCPHVLRRGILNSAFCPQQQEEGLPD
ncbi:centromere protein F-like isoform X2 [Pristis pectinata]|uniref:centromere protein F-like isoform X2 n=1 Tax=Pristis pectinata TaxID=685728 RepID=UPI00223D4238|nr:centromere protein F-like isoform X2 [Pristis pectinata]